MTISLRDNQCTSNARIDAINSILLFFSKFEIAITKFFSNIFCCEISDVFMDGIWSFFFFIFVVICCCLWIVCKIWIYTSLLFRVNSKVRWVHDSLIIVGNIYAWLSSTLWLLLLSWNNILIHLFLRWHLNTCPLNLFLYVLNNFD